MGEKQDQAEDKAFAIEASLEPLGDPRLTWHSRTTPLHPTSDNHQSLDAPGEGTEVGRAQVLGRALLHSELGRQHLAAGGGEARPGGKGAGCAPAVSPSSETCKHPISQELLLFCREFHSHIDNLISFIYLLCN